MIGITQPLLLLTLAVSSVTAHGVITKITTPEKSYTGYLPHAFQKVPTPSWAIPKDQDYGFIMSEGYENPDIICHRDATPGTLSVQVAAGEKIELQWTDWPEGHHGCFLNYLARCAGDCSQADKTQLKFNKIDGECLIHTNPNRPINGPQLDLTTTGYWAGDKLKDAGNKWYFVVPSWLKAGNYVLRNEALAYQRAMVEKPGSGLQNYPQCINLQVTGSGTDDLGSAGTVGTSLYRVGHLGLPVNMFKNPDKVLIPGPAPYVPGQAGSAVDTSTNAAATSAPATQITSDAPAATPTSAAPIVDSQSTSSAPAATSTSAALVANHKTFKADTDAKSDTLSISQLLNNIQDDFKALKSQLVPGGKKSKRTTSAKWRK